MLSPIETTLLGAYLIILSCHSDRTDNSNMVDSASQLEDTTETPEIPRIDFVEMSVLQSHEYNSNTIWYNDFSTKKKYMESKGGIDTKVYFGTKVGLAIMGFNKGDVTGKGNRKVAFGDFPGNPLNVKKDQQFDEIYWRIYVKHEHGYDD